MDTREIHYWSRQFGNAWALGSFKGNSHAKGDAQVLAESLSALQNGTAEWSVAVQAAFHILNNQKFTVKKTLNFIEWFLGPLCPLSTEALDRIEKMALRSSPTPSGKTCLLYMLRFLMLQGRAMPLEVLQKLTRYKEMVRLDGVLCAEVLALAGHMEEAKRVLSLAAVRPKTDLEAAAALVDKWREKGCDIQGLERLSA